MSKQVRFRRGTTAQHSVFTGPAGEITVDTDEKALVVHDGVVAGGVPVARADRPRGFTKVEYFTSNGTYSISGKTDLKRVRVWCYGGGGGGGSGSDHSGGGEGGAGRLELSPAGGGAAGQSDDHPAPPAAGPGAAASAASTLIRSALARSGLAAVALHLLLQGADGGVQRRQLPFSAIAPEAQHP